ncbi:hypothetical protein ACN28S_38675 [Cystobacter fuscus]
MRASLQKKRPRSDREGELAAPVLASPPQATVDQAVAAPLGWFGVNSTGERYCSNCNGQSIILAIAAFKGNTSADARLLQQMRYVLGNNRDPFANGGYMAQHERMMTGMFAIAKRTPRVWDQLTATEKTKIDLIMKATLVGSAYTTADKSNAGGATPTGIDGDTNLDRDWNPNYREGMVGAVIVSTLYLGGRTATDTFLNGYKHASFVTQLTSAGLTRLASVFNTNVANPSAGAPSAATIESAIRDYRYKGRRSISSSTSTCCWPTTRSAPPWIVASTGSRGGAEHGRALGLPGGGLCPAGQQGRGGSAQGVPLQRRQRRAQLHHLRL